MWKSIFRCLSHFAVQQKLTEHCKSTRIKLKQHKIRQIHITLIIKGLWGKMKKREWPFSPYLFHCYPASCGNSRLSIIIGAILFTQFHLKIHHAISSWVWSALGYLHFVGQRCHEMVFSGIPVMYSSFGLVELIQFVSLRSTEFRFENWGVVICCGWWKCP